MNLGSAGYDPGWCGLLTDPLRSRRLTQREDEGRSDNEGRTKAPCQGPPQLDLVHSKRVLQRLGICVHCPKLHPLRCSTAVHQHSAIFNIFCASRRHERALGLLRVVSTNGQHLQSAGDHAIDGVATATSDSNYLDPCIPSCGTSHQSDVMDGGADWCTTTTALPLSRSQV